MDSRLAQRRLSLEHAITDDAERQRHLFALLLLGLAFDMEVHDGGENDRLSAPGDVGASVLRVG